MDIVKRYEMLTENLDDMVSLIDSDALYLYCNRAYLDVLGYAPDELVGISALDIVFVDDREMLVETINHQISMGHTEAKVTARLVCHDGSFRWVDHRVKQLSVDESLPPVTMVIGRDVTEHKAVEDALVYAQEMLRSTLNSIDDMVFVLDTNGVFVDFHMPDPAVPFGYLPEQLIGRHYSSFISEATSEQVSKAFFEVNHFGSTPAQEHHLKFDGEYRTYRARTSARRDSKQKLTGYTVVVTDVTAQKNTEMLANRREALLEAMTQASNILLTKPDLSQALDDVLKVVGDCSQQDRAYIFKRHWDSSRNLWLMSQIHEWVKPGVLPTIGNVELQNIDIEMMASRWHDLLSQGKSVAGMVDDFPEIEQSGLKPQGIISLLVIPIMVDGDWWGFIGLDNCSSTTRWSSGEQKLLEALADSIGAAIKRQQVANDLHESEYRLRELFVGMSQGVLRYDQQGHITHFNDSALRILNTTSEAMIGRTVEEVMWSVVRDDGTDWPPCEYPSVVSLRTGVAFRDVVLGVYTLQKKQIKWISLSTVPLSRPGENLPSEVYSIFEDITDLKSALEAVQQRESMLRTVIDSMPFEFWARDMDGQCFMQNELLVKHWGSLLGTKPGHDGTTPDEAAVWIENNNRAYKGEVVDGEVSYRVLDKQRHYRNIISPITFNDTITGILGVNIDTTEQKLAEQELIKSQTLFTNAFEYAAAGMVLSDMTGRCTKVNRALCDMLGYTEHELLNMSFAEVTHPDDLATNFNEATRLALGEVPSFHMRKRYIHKSGRIVWVRIGASLVRDHNGNPDYVVSQIEDITASVMAEETLKESEDRFRAISEHSHTAICLINIKGHIIWVNEAFVKMGGFQRDAVYAAESFASFIAPESVDFVLTNFMKFASGQPYIEDYEFTFLRADGEARLCQKHMTHYCTRSGELILAISMRDITDGIRALHEKDRLQEELFQAHKMESVGRLAGGVAHDFNNMLGVIIGRTEMAIDQIDKSSALADDLREILSAAQRSADLTRQLLAFARKQTVTPKVLDLNETVSGLMMMLRRVIGEAVQLYWKPEAGLWPVEIDPAQVDQILVNLCVNSRDAIAGQGHITISTSNIQLDDEWCREHHDSIPGEYVSVTVADNGSGISDEALDKIFEPFYTTKETGKGTGLGLSTVYGAVKQNNGYLSVSSHIGLGTEITIYLPRCLGELLSDDVPESVKQMATGSERVMIVEDEPTILSLGEKLLQCLGYTVMSAASGREALELIAGSKEHIDLLLTDVVMPDMNGKDLSEIIQRDNPDVKVLYMSGYTADVIASQGVVDYGLHFIQKPFSLDQLATKIRQVLEG